MRYLLYGGKKKSLLFGYGVTIDYNNNWLHNNYLTKQQ